VLTPLILVFLVLVLQQQLWFSRENIGYTAEPLVYPGDESSFTPLVLKRPIALWIEAAEKRLPDFVSSSPRTLWKNPTTRTWFSIHVFWSIFLSLSWSINWFSLSQSACNKVYWDQVLRFTDSPNCKGAKAEHFSQYRDACKNCSSELFFGRLKG
jgi:hypothetical protein